MGIAFGSINTGLPKDIVKQIINAERIPITKMEGRKGKIEEKQGLLNELIKLVEGVRGDILKNGNARSLREFFVEAREDIVSVVADKNEATPGEYQFEVKQLAQKSSAMTSGFEDPDESYVGVGFIRYTLPNGDSNEIYIDSDNASLNQVAKLINQDESNGLKANVINDGSGTDEPWRLIMSLEETGDINKAQFPYFYFVDGEDDFYLEYQREAQDAIVSLDGFEVELPSNQANELIPGLAIDIKKAAPGEEFTIKVGEDVEKIGEKIKGIIDKINDVLKFIKDQNTLDESSDTSRTLGGDLILQTIESRIRGTIFKDVETNEGFKRLSDIGVTFQRDGLLKFDAAVFDSAISKSYKNVSQILTGFVNEDGVKSSGFIDNVNNTVKLALRTPDGILQSRRNSFRSNIDQIDRRIEQKEKIIEQKERNLKDKFARLEGTISRIKNQGAGVAALGASAAANPVQQLG